MDACHKRWQSAYIQQRKAHSPVFLLLVLCRAVFTLHDCTLEVRPGGISKTLELDYDYDVKGMILNYYDMM